MDKKNLSPKLHNYGGDISKTWFIWYYEMGKRKKKYISTKLDIAERTKAAALIIEQLTNPPAPPITEPYQLALKWLESKKPIWRIKTYQTFKSKADTFFKWLKFNELNKENIKAFFVYLDSEGKHATTRNSYLQFFRQLNKEVFNNNDLMSGVSKVKAIATPAKYFTNSQQKLLKQTFVAQNPDLWHFVQFMYYCFIRPAELRFLRVEDIVLEDSKIVVRAAISKNKKEQYVQIPNPFLEDIEKIIGEKKATDFVFGNGTKARSTNFYSKVHQSILQNLGFDTTRYKLYSWKHTGAVACAKAKISIKELQIQLRHHSLDQTDQYLRQMGLNDLTDISNNFPQL